ncbi:helix-turn-helix domain-containing protein [bacterium]|nr:helix-turn-helix domain-containing protein [bacterium]
MASPATFLPLPAPDPNRKWFSPRGYVEHLDGVVFVWVGGQLASRFDADDRAARDSILLALASAVDVHYGRLAQAFGLSAETLRVLRHQRETEGLAATINRPHRGRTPKVTEKLKTRVVGFLEDGLTVREIVKKLKGKLSVGSVGRIRSAWIAQRNTSCEHSNEGTNTNTGRQMGAQASSSSDAPPQDGAAGAVGGSDDGADKAGSTDCCDAEEDGGDALGRPGEEPGARAIRSRGPRTTQNVQHAGAWIFLALLASEGLYERAREAVESLPAKQRPSLNELYIAIDALVLALAIGERNVEGVRRLATPTAPALLRAGRSPSPPWVREQLGRAAADGGDLQFHAGMAADLVVRASEQTDEHRLVVFYVDNHLRPYTGQKTVRKGYRMQDRRARPGISDYYVHDEDGRPVMRVDVPEHGHLTDWVSPLAESIQAALGPEERILLAFDRGGSFPEHLKKLRNEEVEVLTYERKPYRKFPLSAFEQSFELEGDLNGAEPTVILVHDTRKNLKKGRGRVRRVALRLPSGNQINLLTTSDLDARSLYLIAKHRWRQENGFKHGNERWGINQLDGRRTDPYPEDAIIPNPARRRLDRSLRVARQAEGAARNRLASLAREHPKYERTQQELDEATAHRKQLESLRPHIPKKAPVKDTELAGKLVRHRSEYKTYIDTIRIACANVESDLALLLAPNLPRPAEAKMVLANLARAPAEVRVGRRSITVTLAPAGTDAERSAFEGLLERLSARKLSLPRDSQRRALVFRLQD